MDQQPCVPGGLVTAHDQARQEIGRADTKANLPLTLVAAVLAVVLTTRAIPLAARVAAAGAVALFVLSVLLMLLAARPRLTAHPPPGTWLYAAQVGPSELLESYVDGAGPMALAQDVCVLARIARAKYLRIRWGVDLAMAGVGVLGIAVVLAVVAS